MSEPLIELSKVTLHYHAGDESVLILDDISLTINAGEFVAIVGASGSGKTTLLNIIGCLARPSTGAYKLDGESVLDADRETLARLRREYFGFIFQRYNLLPQLSATENVEVPAVYAGGPSFRRRCRAQELLTSLGLGNRVEHRPNQLSGGQQQRVSIARALMNGGKVLLGDEPTGALDSKSAREVMETFNSLHRQGHTVILVTHDERVAEHAHRIIKIEDGIIVDDRPTSKEEFRRTRVSPSVGSDCADLTTVEGKAGLTANTAICERERLLSFIACLRTSVEIALRSLADNRLRTALTMIGIVIGVAAVVSIVALSAGAKERTLDMIRSLGTNTITFWPSVDSDDAKQSLKRSLTLSDLRLLSTQSEVDSATAEIEQEVLLQHGGAHGRGSLDGVNKDYFKVRGLRFLAGTGFDDDVGKNSQVAVISEHARQRLFGPHGAAIGQIISLNKVPARVVGVIEDKPDMFSDPNALNVWMPLSAATTRIMGRQLPNRLIVRVRDGLRADDAEARLSSALVKRHGRKDFTTLNANSFATLLHKTEHIMTILMIVVAITTLGVAGIGVMNMMLVSINERTREIGIRMAVGARQSDILQQFLTEALFLCVTGGLIGLILSLGISAFVSHVADEWKMLHSPITAVTAFISSTLVGVVFGLMPARRAAGLDPIDALAHE
ncbi:macrolide-specific ABC-type efflux carrier [Caballeronia pedi]|uniref:Pyoverdine export ATP-binding/permease protein PvdT n=1 Tax=Caballeronia pedi TaxID=1777141 RepID=A0A158A173_9BURK|nr:ABC transporter permease [Caballeronia pedi]SAK51541.1 macrolide-specific ABC-type efflux carrier [Caballeronia pedi]